MKPFGSLEARACPLPGAQFDTDQLLPARFMKRPRSEGYGRFLLRDLRAAGARNQDDPRFAGAAILVAAANFGAGSSREAAVYALVDFGFRAVIAPSFGPIFHNNAIKNGLLPLALPANVVQPLLAQVASHPAQILRIDLERQQAQLGDGGQHRFEIDPFHRRCLLEGLDDIDLTLAHEGAIAAYERDLETRRPWALPGPARSGDDR
jgi:3-isopropylmalate/(R)-2-methylmalate dehydratase small subunit